MPRQDPPKGRTIEMWIKRPPAHHYSVGHKRADSLLAKQAGNYAFTSKRYADN
jgi:hypothetical protein